MFGTVETREDGTEVIRLDNNGENLLARAKGSETWVLEHFDVTEEKDDPRKTVGLLYRFDVDQLTWRGRGHRLREGHDHVPWFEDEAITDGAQLRFGCKLGRYCEWCRCWHSSNLSDVARSCGYTRRQLRRELSSDDPVRRALAYIDIAQHHGWDNFDNYPDTMTEHERDVRWGDAVDEDCPDEDEEDEDDGSDDEE